MSIETAATLAAHNDMLFALRDFADKALKEIERLSIAHNDLLNKTQSIPDLTRQLAHIKEQVSHIHQIFRLFVLHLVHEEIANKEKFITYIKGFINYAEENGISGLDFLADYISELEAS